MPFSTIGTAPAGFRGRAPGRVARPERSQGRDRDTGSPRAQVPPAYGCHGRLVRPWLGAVNGPHWQQSASGTRRRSRPSLRFGRATQPDVAFGPEGVGLFGALGEVLDAGGVSDLLQQLPGTILLAALGGGRRVTRLVRAVRGNAASSA